MSTSIRRIKNAALRYAAFFADPPNSPDVPPSRLLRLLSRLRQFEAHLPEVGLRKEDYGRLAPYLFPEGNIFTESVAQAVERYPDRFPKPLYAPQTMRKGLERARLYRSLADLLEMLSRRAMDHYQFNQATAVWQAIGILENVRSEFGQRNLSDETFYRGAALKDAERILKSVRYARYSRIGKAKDK
jgi:hypothetical protein